MQDLKDEHNLAKQKKAGVGEGSCFKGLKTLMPFSFSQELSDPHMHKCGT